MSLDLAARIERGLVDCDDALTVRMLIEALSVLMCVAPPGAREKTAYRMAECALSRALTLRDARDYE